MIRGLARASSESAQLVVLQLDTPGGLDSSMRSIIKAILASPVPVATFVAPSGARAASAGTYILYASHVAAMAPGTNLGAATPVNIGLNGPAKPEPRSPDAGEHGPSKPGAGKGAEESADPQGAMAKKQVHDAAAYIRGLAQMRGRNADWAERAVRQAVSLSADDALAQHVIDLSARDLTDLVRQLDGRRLSIAAGEQTLATAGALVVTIEPDWRNRLLDVIADPSVAMILMLLGIYGLFFEFSSPGFILPGVVGAISLLLGLFALQTLPLNFAGVALLLLGLGFMVAEAFVPSFGSLGIGGVIAFVIGAVMLFDTGVPGYAVSRWSIAAIAIIGLVGAAFVLLVGSLALKARRRPLISSDDQLLGSLGEMLGDAQSDGWAQVRGETWGVHSSVPLARGQQIRVTARHGLVLSVAPLENTAAHAQGGW